MSIYLLNSRQCKMVEYKLLSLVKDTAEAKLWFAVLIQAIRDAGKPCYRGRIEAGQADKKTRTEIIANWRAEQHNKDSAIAWIGGDDYYEVCNRSGIDGDYVIRVLAAVLEQKQAA